MNKIFLIAVTVLALGFAGVSLTGVDLTSSRVGFSMLVLGVGAFGLSLAHLIRPDRIGRVYLVLLTLLGGAYFLGRAVFSEALSLALPDIALVLLALAVYLAAAAKNPYGKKVLIGALFLVCAANVGFAFAQKFGEEAFFVWRDVTQRGQLITGIFGHYNPFTGFMNGSIFFFLTFAFFGKNWALKLLNGLLVLGILLAVIFGESRGGWVSLMIGGAIWLVVVLVYLKQRDSKAFGGALVLGGFLMVAGIVSSFWMVQYIGDKRMEAVVGVHLPNRSDRVHDGGRMAFQQLAFEISQESPLVGMGSRSYSYLSLEHWNPEKRSIHDGVPEFVHNEYLQALSDYGLIGLSIVMLLALAHAISGCFTALSPSEEEDSESLNLLQLGAIGGFVAILSQCFFSFLLHTPSCMALLALLAGVLASKGNFEREGAFKRLLERLVGGLGLTLALALFAVGGVLSQSYLLSLKANEELAEVRDAESALRALGTMMEAGHMGRDAKIFEEAGRAAMKYAAGPRVIKNKELHDRFNTEAKRAFEGALTYHPHFAAAIAGLPRVDEALGNWEDAEKGHELAMQKLWSRESRLQTHFYATQSAYSAGLRAMYGNDREKALGQFRKALSRFERRHELLDVERLRKKEEPLRLEIAGWTSYLEAQLLFKEGDRVWKNARPRNPELAYGLMLEAQKRFQASEAEVKAKNPNWQRFVDQLEYNLTFLAGGRVVPSKLSDEQIVEIIGSEAGLDSQPATR